MKIELFKKLCTNFNREPSEDLYILWNENLRIYDDDEINKAVKTIISNDSYFPTLSRFKEVMKDILNNELKNYDSEKVVREKMERLDIHPSWLNADIKNEPVDEETENIFSDFNSFIEEFRQ